MYKGWDVAPQIQLGMKFDCRLAKHAVSVAGSRTPPVEIEIRV
jgi:hypothetical protein